MSEENWYVADEREDCDFTITSGYDTICGNIGGNTIGEQIDLANRIAKLPQLEREFAEAREQRDRLAEERDELKSKYRTHHDEAERITKQIAAVTEQRDRLAEALALILPIFNFKYLSHTEKQKVKCASEALAAVEGGSHE